MRQPVNTWFNLYALGTSLLVALLVYRDREAWPAGDAPNPMRSTSGIPDLYVFAVQFLGLGSMWFHGSLTEWGGLVDGTSMYVFTAFLPWYTLCRLGISETWFWAGYTVTVVLFTYLHTVLPPYVTISILVAAYLILEIYRWIRDREVLQGDSEAMTLWLTAIASIGAATFFWWASLTGNFLCDPNSFFQPHGLLWHPLAGVSALLLYFFWRREDE